MFRTSICASVLMAASMLLIAAPAAAQQQSVSLNVGYFAVRGEDARVPGDVLVADLTDLAFNISDFSNATVGGEWLIGLGDYMEAGAGVNYYRRTAPSVYANFVNLDGSEIQQDLKLRIVPITVAVRFFPFSRHAGFQPYFGAGLGVYVWRYSETGDFIDVNSNIFRASYVASGTNVGPIAMGGARVPIGSSFAAGGEIRYQKGEGTLTSDFVGDKIDLGGWTYQAVFQIKF